MMLENTLEVDRLQIKNTFIEFAYPDRSPSTRRSQSLPTSPRRFFEDDAPNSPISVTKCFHIDSEEVSTDACTDASDEVGESQMYFNVGESQMYFNVTAPEFVPSIMSTPPVCSNCTSLAQLRSQAIAFKPQSAEEPMQQSYKKDFANVLKYVLTVLQDSELTQSVQISDDSQDSAMVIRLNGEGELATERVLTLTQEALLEAAAQSRCVYVMGYNSPKGAKCGPNPFTATPQGFEVTLGAMENAATACWHLFKKGFCRHGSECNKAHPKCKIQLRVLVETPYFDTSMTEAVDFKMQAADLVTAVLSSLKQSPHVKVVEAYKDADTKCWSVELSPKENGKVHKDYLLTLAKNAFFDATTKSNAVYMLGYDAKPFIVKPDGFGLVLGNMLADSRACWNYYSLGLCKKECSCRWEHPTCLMPVSVVVKSQ